MTPSRRALLGILATAAATAPYAYIRTLTPDAAAATATTDRYPSNTALYADPALAEGRDYGRRYKRHGQFDGALEGRVPFPKTGVIAPHGGGIEPGTSELCLAVAGYHPASPGEAPVADPAYDYWMFEGLRSSGNAELHVTSTHCDDTVALSLCVGSLNVVALHGCSTSQAGLPDGTAAVLVGGRNSALKERLLDEYARAGFQGVDALSHPTLGGTAVENITNRTLLGTGAQLEITTPLRMAMFEHFNSRDQRKTSTTGVFWDFVAATRAAVARTEAEQVIL